MLDLKKQCVALLKIREWSLISSEGFRPSPGHDDISVITVTRLVWSFQCMCFIKPLGSRVGSGGDPLPDPSVYDTKDHLKKRARSVVE